MLYNVLLIVQIVISVSIIGLVLIQHGKGADAGAAFGSGASASSSVFGSRGSGSFLSRTTAILAALFFANCLALAWIVAHKPETTSLVDSIVAAPATKDAKPTAIAPSEKVAPADAAKKSPADEIPADTGEAAQKAPTPAATTNKASDIPE